FFGDVYDYGVDNLWESNFYYDYDGSGVYMIPGSAGSMDQDPIGMSIPATTSTSSTSAAPVSNGNLIDLVLGGIIAIEMLVILVIVNARKHSLNY
ncbi:MAG: hypothetical protein ACFFD6_11000, partial [Candidatus Thorarchaeota archaeon]